MIRESLFGHTREGKVAKRYLLSNQSGMEVELSDFGASILAIRLADKTGKMLDVLLGYDTLEEYYDNSFVKMACDYIKTSGMTLQEIEKLLEQIKSQKDSDDT